MANATWPSGLPQSPLFASFQESVASQVATTTVDSGPTFIRRIASASPKYQQLAVALSVSDYENTFLPFFNNTLAGGSLPFDWSDPVSGNTATFQFVPGSGGVAGSKNDAGFSVAPYRSTQLILTMTLEQLP